MATALTSLRHPRPRRPARSVSNPPRLKRAGQACTCSKEPAPGVIASTAREPSPITPRSLEDGRLTTRPAPTRLRLSLKALILPSPKPWASCPISARVIPTRKSLRSSKSHWALWNPCLCAQAERDREAAPSKLSGKLHGFTERSLRSLAQRSRRCFTSAS